MSPRRSSRARITQPSPSLQQHTDSSSSSTSSGHAARNAQSQLKSLSQRSSIAARSQSSEDRDGASRPQERRTRRSQDEVKDDEVHLSGADNEEDVEEEITRCICGNQEYPGLPNRGDDVPKDRMNADPDPVSISQDSTGWFIQCDMCKVWQHGGCVGITDESTSPEEYYCEQCRMELHQTSTLPNGRKYSRYLPAQDSKSVMSSPESKDKEIPKTSRESRASRVGVDNLAKGRRATMNSRDSAYDEAEQLRRAIEESKKESEPVGIASSRRGKRSRSESEEHLEDSKRQRTTSVLASSQSRLRNPDAESDEAVERAGKERSTRGGSRDQRNKEGRDRETAREKEVVGRRRGRIEKKAGEDLEPSPDSGSRAIALPRGNISSEKTFAPPAPPDPSAPKAKRTGRPPARRGRMGRNQYTKDRDIHAHEMPTTNSPARSHHSQDPDGLPTRLNGHTNGNNYLDSSSTGRSSKPRYMNPSRTTLNDMKRRVAGILEFISHTQVEMAGIDASPRTTKSSTSTSTPPDGHSIHNRQNGKNKLDLAKATDKAMSDLEGIDEEAFAALSSIEMMEVLTRRLMRWQAEYGKYVRY